LNSPGINAAGFGLQADMQQLPIIRQEKSLASANGTVVVFSAIHGGA